MAQVKKIVLSSSRDIPLDRLVLSQSNVRRIKAGVSIEELADDIARRTLLQSITVRAVRDADGVETGMFEIPAGGRRFRALELLVKQKRLAKNAPVPCVVREDGTPEEDSLAENVQRAPLHPLDQFRAFLSLREKGQSEEEIAAAFFVPVSVVRQRLRLASVSPKLLDVYTEDGMTLEQLMAFTVSGDHERQEQVFERLCQSYDKQPYAIRRMLTEGAVRANDKRAQYIGVDAYVEAGGVILRDLFEGDNGGWLQDVGLVDMLVAEKLRDEAEAIRAEGWKWIEVAPDFAYGHSYGLRRLRGETVELTDQEHATRGALQAELGAIEATYAETDEDLPDDVDHRLGEIETAMAAFDERPIRFEADEVSRAGAFVSIDGEGGLRVDRGYVRPEDELPVETEPVDAVDDVSSVSEHADRPDDGMTVDPVSPAEPEEDEGIKPFPDRLLTELTAHRTLALRHALDHRRYHQRQRLRRARAYPRQADPARPRHQPRHQHRPAHLPSGTARDAVDLHGVRVVDLPAGSAHRAAQRERCRCIRHTGGDRRGRVRAQLPLSDRRRPRGLEAGSRLRRRAASDHRVPRRDLAGRDAAAVHNRRGR